MITKLILMYKRDVRKVKKKIFFERVVRARLVIVIQSCDRYRDFTIYTYIQ